MRVPQWPLPAWAASIRSKNLSGHDLARLLLKRGEKMIDAAMMQAMRYRDLDYDLASDRALIYEAAHRLELMP